MTISKSMPGLCDGAGTAPVRRFPTCVMIHRIATTPAAPGSQTTTGNRVRPRPSAIKHSVTGEGITIRPSYPMPQGGPQGGPRSENRAWDPRACRLGGSWGPGSWPDAFLRKAALIECDPAPAVCAKLLTFEIFLTRNLGVKASAQGTKSTQTGSKPSRAASR